MDWCLSHYGVSKFGLSVPMQPILNDAASESNVIAMPLDYIQCNAEGIQS